MTKGYKRLLLVVGHGLPALGPVLVAVGTPDALEAVDGVVRYGKHGAGLELAAADLDGGAIDRDNTGKANSRCGVDAHAFIHASFETVGYC